MSEETSTVAIGKFSRLEGKVALITGGATGIGEAIVRLFVKHGAKVIIADIADETAEKLAEELGVSASCVHCNVIEEEDIIAAVDVAVKMHGCLDIMYNNAGIIDKSRPRSVAEYDMDDFDRVMKVNVRGTMLGIKHAARVMIPRKKGCIICTASIAGVVGGVGPYAYTASKHSIVGLTRNSAAELGKYGIRVNCISPYGVASSMSVWVMKSLDGLKEQQLSISEEDKAAVENFSNSVGNLKGPTLKAQDIAEAGLYLASDEAKYVSGHNLVVDGGVTVVNHSWGLYR
eukprot:Gb_07560 [translate_table: standard]